MLAKIMQSRGALLLPNMYSAKGSTHTHTKRDTEVKQDTGTSVFPASCFLSCTGQKETLKMDGAETRTEETVGSKSGLTETAATSEIAGLQEQERGRVNKCSGSISIKQM